MSASRRRGLTLVELMVSSGFLVLLLGGILQALSSVHRMTDQIEAESTAVSRADLGMGVILGELHSMAPPGDATGTPAYEILDGGRGIRFRALRAENDRFRAEKVELRLEPAGKGRYHLLRNGTTVLGVELTELEFSLPRTPAPLTDEDVLTDQDLEAPLLEVRVAAAGSNAPRASDRPHETHEIVAVVPIPEASPAVTLGLPRAAKEVLAAAVVGS